MLLSLNLISKLDSLLAFDINVSSPVAATLLLVLLLRESLALRHDEILVSLLGVVVGDIGVARQPVVDLGILRDPRETFVGSSWKLRGGVWRKRG